VTNITFTPLGRPS